MNRLKFCHGRGEVYNGRYDEAPTSNAARVWQRVWRDMQAERAAGPLKRTYPKLFFCSLRPEMENFCPGIEILSPGQLHREWTTLVFNEGVIEHRGTTARVFHAGRVIHAGICIRKTENRTDYSAKILEENGDLWNQV